MNSKKNIFKILLLLVLCAIIISGCSKENATLDPVDVNDSSEVEFVIQNGSTLTAVANELQEKGYISSSKALLKYAQENSLTNIKAGTYLISKSMPADALVDMFYSGKVYKGKKLVVQEGLEAVQIAAKIEELGLGSAEKFTELVNNPELFSERFEFLKDEKIRSLEGYLFPLTYYFKETDSEEYIINEMLKGFEIVYETEIAGKMPQSNLSLNDIVILASIVGREAAIDDEMPLVASVFENRMNIGMPLQSCATVQYIIKERKWILSNEETAIDSPFNTYKYKGLPAGAIASPSLKALLAVIEHPATDYMYFLAKNDGTGAQVYSKTYDEHLINKKKYLG